MTLFKREVLRGARRPLPRITRESPAPDRWRTSTGGRLGYGEGPAEQIVALGSPTGEVGLELGHPLALSVRGRGVRSRQGEGERGVSRLERRLRPGLDAIAEGTRGLAPVRILGTIRP